MEIIELVNKLEAMATQAKKIPMAGRAMVDAEAMLDLIDQIKLSVPRNLQDAQEVLDRREQIVNQTMLDARRIRSTAEGDARALVEESEMVKAAKIRVDELIADAQKRGDRLIEAAKKDAIKRREGANQYSLEALQQLEEQVNSILSTIHAGQRALDPEGYASDGPTENIDR